MTLFTQISPSYLHYWAKAARPNDDINDAYFHRLPYHLLDVAACMEQLFIQMPRALEHLADLFQMPPDNTRSLLVWLSALHDAGKFSTGFQCQREDIFHQLRNSSGTRGYHIRHDALGKYLIIEELLRKDKNQDWLGVHKILSGRGWTRKIEPLIDAVAGHHGKPVDFHEPADCADLFLDADRQAFLDFARDSQELFHVAPSWGLNSEDFPTRIITASWIFAGWMVLADWLGSNREFFPFRDAKHTLSDYWNIARKQAARAVASSGVIAPPTQIYRGMNTLFPGFNALRPLQDYAEHVELEDGPQLFVFEDATGSGKTEAALILALRLMNQGLASGLYIGLPTTATANGMYHRMAAAYQRIFDSDKPTSLMLAHSSRDLSEQFQASIQWGRADTNPFYDRAHNDETASAICEAWLGDHRKKALLAPVGVGTIDQALLASLPAKHQSLRLVGLSQKVLIVDEVHAYDEYMNGLLKNLIRFHASQGGSAILLSATLPIEVRDDFINTFRKGLGQSEITLENKDFPLVTQAGKTLVQTSVHAHEQVAQRAGRPLLEMKTQRVAVTLEEDRERCVDQLVTVAQSGECGVWIRNTVGDAIDAYHELSARLGQEKVILFHARFTLQDRLDIENRVLALFGKESRPEDRAGRVVVATQVIEQSLDLDFDFMVSDLAPIDLIIQRAGRLQRHKRPDRTRQPLLTIYGPHPNDDANETWFNTDFGASRYVYKDLKKLWLTAKVLTQEGEISIPDSARKLVEFVYGHEYDDLLPLALEDLSIDAEAERMEERNMARFNTLDFEKGYAKSASGRWFEDVHTPTRLGDMTTTLRLIRLDGSDTPSPWADANSIRRAWRLSELSIRASWIDELLDSPISATTLEKLKEDMPDKGRWVQLLPLTKTPEGAWQARVHDHVGRPCLFTYSETQGLQMMREET